MRLNFEWKELFSMPPVSEANKTTKVLVALLVLSLFFLLGLVALTEHNKAMASLEVTKRELAARRDAHLAILEDEQQALERAAWIKTSQPTLSDAAISSSALLDLVKQTAQDCGVELAATKLLEPTEGSAGPEIGLEVRATVPFENAVRFLYSLQSPEKFISATRLSIKPDAEPPNVVLELRLVRHYRRQLSNE